MCRHDSLVGYRFGPSAQAQQSLCHVLQEKSAVLPRLAEEDRKGAEPVPLVATALVSTPRLFGALVMWNASNASDETGSGPVHGEAQCGRLSPGREGTNLAGLCFRLWAGVLGDDGCRLFGLATSAHVGKQ